MIFNWVSGELPNLILQWFVAAELQVKFLSLEGKNLHSFEPISVQSPISHSDTNKTFFFFLVFVFAVLFCVTAVQFIVVKWIIGDFF